MKLLLIPMKKLIDFIKPVRKLHTVIFFVTSRCNALCRTCFYWQELNKKGDLTLDEIKTLSETMPPFHDLLLSGGEPSLRRELPEIVNLFYTNNGIRRIYFPTNGLKPELIKELIERILEENELLEIFLNNSIDGFPETNDRIRSVPGNFNKSLETIRLARALKPRFGTRLQINVNSVICAENYNELPELGRFFLDNERLDYHYFQIIRGDALDKSLKRVPKEELRKLYKEITKIHGTYASRQGENRGTVNGWIRKSLYSSVFNFHHKTQFNNYTDNIPWPMSCTAGETSVVIDYDGTLRACELRGSLWNLRDYGCDFKTLWNSNIREDELNSIAEDKCFCTHVCFIHDSMWFSERVMLWELPKSYLTRYSW
jgi:MoaA/NifB/PqqE/SkfB family radical SAM enzyme